jgi:hypothetical protein
MKPINLPILYWSLGCHGMRDLKYLSENDVKTRVPFTRIMPRCTFFLSPAGGLSQHETHTAAPDGIARLIPPG